jgi:hypothetical protein
MSNRNRVKIGVAAVIGVAVLAVTPGMSSARTLATWDACPALDTEPMCDLEGHAASNGAGSRPAAVEPAARRDTTDVHVDVTCASRPILQIIACAR